MGYLSTYQAEIIKLTTTTALVHLVVVCKQKKADSLSESAILVKQILERETETPAIQSF
jgi:hypothetical protein